MRTSSIILLSALWALTFTAALRAAEVAKLGEPSGAGDDTAHQIGTILTEVEKENHENTATVIKEETDYNNYKFNRAMVKASKTTFDTVTAAGAFLSVSQLLRPFFEWYCPPAVQQQLSTLPPIPYSDNVAFLPAVTATAALTVGALTLYMQLQEEDVLDPKLKDAIERLSLPKKIRLQLTRHFAEILHDYRVVTQENNELLKAELQKTNTLAANLEQEISSLPKTGNKFDSVAAKNAYAKKITEIDHNLHVVGEQLTALPKILVAHSKAQAEALKKPKREQQKTTLRTLAKLF